MVVTKTHPIKSTLKAVRSTNGRAARRTARSIISERTH